VHVNCGRIAQDYMSQFKVTGEVLLKWSARPRVRVRSFLHL